MLRNPVLVKLNYQKAPCLQLRSESQFIQVYIYIMKLTTTSICTS